MATKRLELIEKLSELEHQRWTEWSTNISSNESLSPEILERWKSCWKPYKDLTEEQKEQDRIWARKVLKIIENEGSRNFFYV